jgi:hypothetical protein
MLNEIACRISSVTNFGFTKKTYVQGDGII